MRMDLYVKELHERIAALEAGVEKALIQIGGGLCCRTASSKHAQLRDAQATLEALTSSDGAGECTCAVEKFYGSFDSSERRSWTDPKCPIHSPTSAAEDREDGLKSETKESSNHPTNPISPHIE